MPTVGWAEGANATEPEAQCYSEAKRLVYRYTIRSTTDPAMRPAQGRPTKAAAQAAKGVESGGATHIPSGSIPRAWLPYNVQGLRTGPCIAPGFTSFDLSPQFDRAYPAAAGWVEGRL
jgi:hypothetical protein